MEKYQVSNIEKMKEGDVFRITPENPDEKIDIGSNICAYLSGDNLSKIFLNLEAKQSKEDFLRGAKPRPGGVYAVYFSNGQVVAQNVNAQGIKEYQNKLEESVYNVCELN